MSNTSDPEYKKDSQNKDFPIDKTFIEGSTPIQQLNKLSPGTKINSTSFGSANPFTKISGQTKISSSNMSIDMLPSGNEPIPLGSGTIVSLLGSGGMARVYKIWNEKLEVFRAAKILIPGQSDLKNRFDTEAKITAKLHHPNIVEIYNVGDWNNLPYLEMEFIDGDSLEAFIAKFGVLPASVCSSIAIFVARALSYAHSQEFLIYGKTYHGVIHRDLKPANIMISKNGDVRLMDFGIARPTEASLHTVEGNIVGTMQYLSPEQLDGVDIDGRTDIYSLGAILYEMLTGTKTFPQDTITNLMKKKIMNEYRRFSDFDFNIQSSLSKISQKCLQLNKEDRFHDVEALLNELGTVHRSLTSDPPGKVIKEFISDPESFKGSSKKKYFKISTKIVLPTLAVAVLAGVVSFVLMTDPENDAERQVPVPKKDTVKVSIPVAQPDTVTIVTPEQIKKDTIEKPVSMKPETTIKKPLIKPTKITSTTVKTPISAEEPAVTEVVVEQSPIELLQKKYSSTDPVKIGKNALAARSYNDAIVALETTPKSHPDYVVKTLLLFQAFVETGRTNDALLIANSESPTDAQYDFLCGRLYGALGKTKQALDYYQSALTKPSLVRTRNDIRNDALYNTAVIWSNQYKDNPGSEARIQALNAWNIVKKTYSSTPNHERFKKANLELASIH